MILFVFFNFGITAVRHHVADRTVSRRYSATCCVCQCGVLVWFQIRVRMWTAASRCASWRPVGGRCVGVVPNTAACSMTRSAVRTVRPTSMSATSRARRAHDGLTSASSDEANAPTVSAASEQI